MRDDAEKIVRLSEVLAAKDSDMNEAVGLALLIEDEDEREIYLVDVARSFLEKGDWRRAHGVTELMPAGYERADLLRKIAEYLGSSGNIERSLFIFDEAETAAVNEAPEGYWQQAELLNKIANSLSFVNAKTKCAEVRQRAIDTARSGQNSGDKQQANDSDSVLAEIILDIANAQEIQSAIRTAGSLSSVSRRERVLSEIASVSSGIKKVA